MRIIACGYVIPLQLHTILEITIFGHFFMRLSPPAHTHTHTHKILQLFKMEDVSMGMWVEQFNSTKHVQYSHNWKYCQYGCMENYHTAHYQSPRQMICLWDNLMKGHPHCCNVWGKPSNCSSVVYTPPLLDPWSCRSPSCSTKMHFYTRLEASRSHIPSFSPMLVRAELVQDV